MSSAAALLEELRHGARIVYLTKVFSGKLPFLNVSAAMSEISYCIPTSVILSTLHLLLWYGLITETSSLKLNNPSSSYTAKGVVHVG